MTQRVLDLFGDDAPSGDTEALIGRFKESCRGSGKAPSTIAAEVSQLRSVARDAKTHLGIALADLLDRPEGAAELIELAGLACGRSTVLTRSRALQRLALLHLGEGEGRSWVTAFRAALPKTKSNGWHDSGLSLPGTRGRARPRSPTPDAAALEAILQLAAFRSPLDGAIAGLACFSGLELDEICELRWSDLTWRDDSDATFCEVGVHRRGRRTTCLIVPMGARPLFSLALTSGLQRGSYVFPGRKEGEHLSKTAMRDRLRHMCEDAGWPGLSRSQLTAAFVLWLREHGLDDHSIRLNLGRRRAATIDRLTRSHESIAAQLSVDAANRGLEL